MRILKQQLSFLNRFYVNQTTGWGAALTCVLIVGIFWSLTLHPGHSWTGDFSQYIHHAANLANGEHFADTGYIVSNGSRFLGPYTYPPVFPLLLAPVYWIYGLNLEALKSVSVVSFCLFLLLIPLVIGDKLSHVKSLLIIVLVGANPIFWSARNEIESEFTFMFFTFFALWLMQRKLQESPQKFDFSGVINCMLIGLVMYLSYGSRTIGLILPLCIITYEVVVRRKITLVSILSTSTFMLLAYAQYRYLNVDFTPPDIKQNLHVLAENMALPSASSFIDFIDLDPGSILERMKRYYWTLQLFLPASNNALFEFIIASLFKLSVILACWGYLIVLKRRIGVIEIFCAGYVAVLLLFGAPAYGRYLFPAFPFFLYYAFIAYESVFSVAGWPKTKHVTSAVILALITISYSHDIYTHDNSDRSDGVTHPDALSVFDFIRGSTEQDAIIVTRNPRIVALFTDRSSVGNIRIRDPSDKLTDEFYVASGGDYYLYYERHGRWVPPFRKASPPTDSFREVFRNSRFVLYKFDGGLDTTGIVDTQ